MKRCVISLLLIVCALIVPGSASAQELQQKLAAVKAAAAKNAQEQRSYTWVEKTELLLKGEVKNTKIESCKYGPDGKVQKTPIVEPPPPEKKRGLKGKIVAKKTGEMKEELESAAALVHRYVPPSPDNIQVVMNAGTASMSQAGPGAMAFKFPGYLKAGDALTITFDAAITSIRGIAVTSWLEQPSEPLSFQVTMQSLPDGLSYPGKIVLSIPSSKIEVRITKSNYQKLAR
jgi:hypothetical protein